jgi:hypothetical protein
MRVFFALVLALMLNVVVWGHQKTDAVQWDVLMSGTNSNVNGPSFVRLRTRGDFVNYWSKLGLGAAPNDVNFNTQEVVAIHMDPKANISKVFVETLDVESNQLCVRYATMGSSSRHSSGGKSSSSGSAYTIIRLDRWAGGIKYVGRTATNMYSGIYTSCGCTRCQGVCQHRCGCRLSTFPFNLDWSVIATGTYCPYQNQASCIIYDSTVFEQYWYQILANDPKSRMPSIDWKNEMVVAVHLGNRLSGGYSVKVSDVQLSGFDQLSVFYVETQPTGFRSQGMTQPYTLIRVPRYAVTLRTFQTSGSIGLRAGIR